MQTSSGDRADLIPGPVAAELGLSIVSGEVPPGAVIRLDDIITRFGMSRTTARDVMHVLTSLGLVESRRRVGLVVQPMARWHALHPTVIAWRIASSRRHAQLRSLSELRLAVEPAAAAFAAARRSEAQAEELMMLAASLESLAENPPGRRRPFADADARFHQLILEATDNEMFAAMAESIVAALRARVDESLTPVEPKPHSYVLHRRVAEAIARRDSVTAEGAMRAIVVEVIDEVAATR